MIFLHSFFSIENCQLNLSVTCYQENKERLQKKLLKDIKIFVKKKNKNRNNMVMMVTKNYIKMKKNC